MQGSEFPLAYLDTTGYETGWQESVNNSWYESTEDLKSLHSFLSLICYLTKYSGCLATLSSVLCHLIEQDVAYSWEKKHSRAFNDVKKEVFSLGVLQHLQPDAETTIQTDASLRGLGEMLSQRGQPVCYASKAFTGTEPRFSNVKRETLGVMWGLERFHYFIKWKKSIVQTD